MTLSDRIREAISHSGKSHAQIAAETRKSPGAVSQWLDGRIKSLRADTAEALERPDPKEVAAPHTTKPASAGFLLPES